MAAAQQVIRSSALLEVPLHLRNAPIKGMSDQGYGKDYQYPHDHEKGIVQKQYFPLGVAPQSFYEPTDRGFEAEVKERLQKVRQIIGR